MLYSFLGPPESTPKMASRLVQPFSTTLIFVSNRHTDKHTDRQTDRQTEHATSIAVGCIFACSACQCGLITTLDILILLLVQVLFLVHIACMECKDAAYCYMCSVVCVSVCFCAFIGHNRERTKTSEPVKMPFGLWSLGAQGTVC